MLLDTVLNLGMNDHTYHQLSKATGNEYFAATIYYKYLIMFGSTILKIDHKLFDNIINSELKLNNLTNKNDLNIESLNKIIDQFKLLGGYPDDPYVQLRMSIEAMYCSWFSDR
jgi:pyruvate,orthophosphate dikinase